MKTFNSCFASVAKKSHGLRFMLLVFLLFQWGFGFLCYSTGGRQGGLQCLE
jgi:hypothetical protein